MIRVEIQEAEANLSELVAQARAGEEIVLMRGSEPIAKIIGIDPVRRESRKPGRLKGLIDFDDRFFDPLPEDELEAWNNPK